MKQGVESLRAGGVVAIPTETVYGLAARADRVDSVAKIFAAKQRPFFDPLIVHIDNISDLYKLTSAVPEQALELAKAFWPGPLTLVLPKAEWVPELVTSGLPTVAIRMPAHPIAREIIRSVGAPLAAPSANLFGRISPTTSAAVEEQLGQVIDGTIEGGPCEVGIESTIISFWEGQVTCLRLGGIALETLEKVIGTIQIHQSNAQKQIPAPGTLPKHYSPRTPMELISFEALISKLQATQNLDRLGVLAFQSQLPTPIPHYYDLSPLGSLTEAATHLYDYMRKLDSQDIDIIYAVPVPSHGLGSAINDRLTRAAYKE